MLTLNMWWRRPRTLFPWDLRNRCWAIPWVTSGCPSAWRGFEGPLILRLFLMVLWSSLSLLTHSFPSPLCYMSLLTFKRRTQLIFLTGIYGRLQSIVPYTCHLSSHLITWFLYSCQQSYRAVTFICISQMMNISVSVSIRITWRAC